MIRNALLFIALGVLSVSFGVQSAVAQSPLTPNSKFACIAATPKNKIGKRKANGTYRNTTFDAAKEAIKEERKSLSNRLNTVKGLIKDLEKNREDESWVKSFDKLSKSLLGQSGKIFQTEDQKVAALNNLTALLQGQIQERNAQLSALTTCKKSQFSADATTTYKFAVIGRGTSRPVVYVVAVAPAFAINNQKQYCGHVPSLTGGTALVALPRYFGTDACYIAYHPTDGCKEEIGAGNLGVWVTRWELNSPQTDAQLDGVIGQLAAIYNGTANFRALNPGEFCS